MSAVITFVLSLLFVSSAWADCFELVQSGEPGFRVIEKCGEPERREREEITPPKKVELIQGTESMRVSPVRPIVLERWYYDTSLNAATVIHLEDGGVTAKERLLRAE